MPTDKFTIEFMLSGVPSSLDAYFRLPVQEGEDWYCLLYVHGVVNCQRFYGTSYAEAIVNTVNFVTSITEDPPPPLVRHLAVKRTERLSVRYVTTD